jgi:hypothetical protein
LRSISLVVDQIQASKDRALRYPSLEPWTPRKDLADKWSKDPSEFWLPHLQISGNILCRLFDNTDDLDELLDRIYQRFLCLLAYDLLNQGIPGTQDAGSTERNQLAKSARFQQLASIGLGYHILVRSYGSGILIVLPGHLDSHV